MKNSSFDWTSIALFALWSLLVALLTTLIFHRNLLQLDSHVTAGNIIQAIATIVTGIVVAMYFQKLLQLDRKEKDLVLAQLDLLLDLIGELEEMGPNQELVDINLSLKKLSQKVIFVESIVRACHFNEAAARLAECRKAVKTIRKMATETSIKGMEEFAGTNDCPVNIQEGIVRWADNRKREIEMELFKLKNAVFDSQLLVNSR
jgi:hypothetical protein